MQWPWELCLSNPLPSLMFPCSGLSVKQGSFLCAEMFLVPHGPDMPSMWSEEQVWKGPQKSPNPLSSSRKKQEAHSYSRPGTYLVFFITVCSSCSYCSQFTEEVTEPRRDEVSHGRSQKNITAWIQSQSFWLSSSCPDFLGNTSSFSGERTKIQRDGGWLVGEERTRSIHPFQPTTESWAFSIQCLLGGWFFTEWGGRRDWWLQDSSLFSCPQRELIFFLRRCPQRWCQNDGENLASSSLSFLLSPLANWASGLRVRENVFNKVWHK